MGNRLYGFIDNIKSAWTEELIKNSYPFIENIFLLQDEFKKICVSATKDKSKYYNTVVEKTLVTVHELMVESLIAGIVGQRIALHTLNRSIIENYIVLSFVLKYGDAAARIFVAHGEVTFQKYKMKSKTDLTDEEKAILEGIIQETRNLYPEIKLGNGYKWANGFLLGHERNSNCSLKDLALDLDLEDDYSDLSLLHERTHSSSAMAHLFNINHRDSYVLNLHLLVMPVKYAATIVKVLKYYSNFKHSAFFALEKEINDEFTKIKNTLL